MVDIRSPNVGFAYRQPRLCALPFIRMNAVILTDSIHSPAATVCFDPELIRRYDRNGPRYTSYPTAVEFHPGCDASDYQLAAARSNARLAGPLSIYVHVPFCASPCFYCGCNKVITRDHRKADFYLAYLFKEIELQTTLFASHRTVEQLHLGGGTPTFLSQDQLRQLMDKLARHFALQSNSNRREYSIEIDPRTLEPTTLSTLAELGFNRLSLGVQDFDPEVQAAVNRVQSEAATLDAITQAKALGFQSISVDLIYGLPLQTQDKFARTLASVIKARPNRVAVYGYAHMPRMFKAQRQINEAQLPSAAQRLQLLRQTIESLTGAGYVYIGMDHFALPDDELVNAQRSRTLQRNFQGYSTKAECDLVALGVSAIGKVDNVYVQNAKTLNEYYAALGEGQLPIQRGIIMSKDDILRHAVIQQIMCHGELKFAELSSQLGIQFEHYFADELTRLRSLADDGLLTLTKTALHVTAKGRLLLRHIAMEFDAYLPKAAHNVFSKAI
jgi:oxygen-independent coproporphyrinogen III oxidase